MKVSDKDQKKNNRYGHYLRHPEFGPHIHHHDLEKFHRQLRVGKPISLLFNLMFLIILILWQGFGWLVVVYTVFMVLREIVQLNFFLKLQKRVIEPAQILKEGIQSVAKGDFDVQLETEVNNEFKDLLDSFNDMTVQLKEMNNIKDGYEENRKNLIANITHDIKTPLASIQGYMETINEGTITDKATIKRYNEIILSNVQYTNKLIDDLFLFSKLDLDKIQFNFTAVNCHNYLRDLMEEMEFEVEDMGYLWTYSSELDEDTQMLVDTKRIYQTIRNIVGNSIKYGANDNLHIQVKTYQNKESCLIKISDNGPGIPQDQLDFIFDRFYRVDQARTKDTMSTGLGLAIAKELVEAHRGSVSIKSNLGEGTSILIDLPLSLHK